VQVIAAAQVDEPRPGIVGLAALVAAIAIGITMLATGIPAPRRRRSTLAALRAEWPHARPGVRRGTRAARRCTRSHARWR